MDEKIQLRINEIPAQHVGKGIVIVDPSVIKKYGWHAGQILEIVGSRKTYAKLWPGSMENNDFDYIRIDGITRQNVGAGIGDKVLVRSIEVVSAEQIVLSPTENQNYDGLQGILENFIRLLLSSYIFYFLTYVTNIVLEYTMIINGVLPNHYN